MSTSSAATRPETKAAPPYTVLIHATSVRKEPGSYVVGVRPYVDLNLTPEQRQTLTDLAARVNLNAAALFERILIVGGLLAGFIGATFSSYSANYPALAGWIIGGALVVSAGLAMNRHVRTGMDRIESLIAELTAAGALAEAPFDEAKTKDLKRIQSRLDALRKRGVTGQDWRFQSAAEKVMTQDRHRPTLKHVAIADSNGSDPATRKIRKLVKEQRKAWKADVADAELAIVGLTDSVSLLTPATV